MKKMKKTISIIALLVSFFITHGQSKNENCSKRLIQPEYKLKVCLKDMWYIDTTETSQLIIGDHKTNSKIGISRPKENNKKSSKDVWEKEYWLIIENQTFIPVKDTSFQIGNHEMYIVIHKYFDISSEMNIRVGTAILNSEKNYQTFDTSIQKI